MDEQGFDRVDQGLAAVAEIDPAVLRLALDLLVPWEIALALSIGDHSIRERVLGELSSDEDRANIKIVLANLGRVRVSDVQMAWSRFVDAINLAKRTVGSGPV